MNKDIENLIGNVYQSIWGNHDEKCKVIGEWLDEIRKLPNIVDSEDLVHRVVDNKDYRIGDVWYKPPI